MAEYLVKASKNDLDKNCGNLVFQDLAFTDAGKTCLTSEALSRILYVVQSLVGLSFPIPMSFISSFYFPKNQEEKISNLVFSSLLSSSIPQA